MGDFFSKMDLDQLEGKPKKDAPEASESRTVNKDEG